MFYLPEKRFTALQNIKKSGPQQAQSLRSQLVPLLYEAIKAYKRWTTKPLIASALHGEILLRDFGTYILTAEATLMLKASSSAKRKAPDVMLAEDESKTSQSSSTQAESSVSVARPSFWPQRPGVGDIVGW